MINVRELRIGNIIEFEQYDPSQIGSKPKWDLMEITYGDHSNIVSKPNGYRAIPLTEEWLVRFGFEDNGTTFDFYDEDTGFEMEISWCSRILSTGQRLSLHLEGFRHIDSIHKLQNWYFFTTGKELELK